jgi:hypothetical protein
MPRFITVAPGIIVNPEQVTSIQPGPEDGQTTIRTTRSKEFVTVDASVQHIVAVLQGDRQWYES